MPINPKDYPPKCPGCSNELTRIGYTEHGTLELHSGKWLESDSGADADHYCLLGTCLSIHLKWKIRDKTNGTYSGW